MKKYLFVSHSPYLHGAELCLLESVIAFKTFDNNDVCVVIPYEKNSELESRLVEQGATVISGVENPRWVDFKFNVIPFAIKTLRTIFTSLTIIKKYRPDFIIINTVTVSPAFAIAGRLLRSKIIWYIHELGDLDHGYTYLLGRANTYRIIKWLSIRQVFNSKYTANHFEVKKAPSIVRYAVTERMGTDMCPKRQSLNTTSHHWNIVLIGRTWKGKGQDQAIEAARILRDSYRFDSYTLRIIGAVNGSYLDYLQLLVTRYNLSGNVEIIPFGNNVSDFLSSADVGITSSLHEAFGRVTVEYLKYGLITVGARSGGTFEILADFNSSFTYNPMSPEDLASKLISIVSKDPNLLRTGSLKDSVKAHSIYSLKNHYHEFQAILSNC